jgi:hypothetical protein
MTLRLGLLLLARADSDCFAVIREFEAESTNTCWFGFKSGGLPGECRSFRYRRACHLS